MHACRGTQRALCAVKFSVQEINLTELFQKGYRVEIGSKICIIYFLQDPFHTAFNPLETVWALLKLYAFEIWCLPDLPEKICTNKILEHGGD